MLLSDLINNISEHHFYFLKTDIQWLRCTEKFPFDTSCVGPERLKNYKKTAPTRTFSNHMAKKLVCNRYSEIPKNKGVVFCFPWDTIRNIFKEGEEEGEKIVLQNNAHLKLLVDESIQNSRQRDITVFEFQTVSSIQQSEDDEEQSEDDEANGETDYGDEMEEGDEENYYGDEMKEET